MTMRQQLNARRASPVDAHYFFGFHDASPWDDTATTMLALAVDSIDHPPLKATLARVGVVDVASDSFVCHDTTTGWNFPQGARQLWLHDRTRYAYNCPDGEQPRTRLRTRCGSLLREHPWSVAAVSPRHDVFYSIDFARVHRAGGYGHTGVRRWSPDVPIEREGAIVAIDVSSGNPTILASIEACRRAAERPATADAADDLDYVTHVLPSPSGDRICFLYRSWLADGGIDTALMVIDADGTNLRALLRGNLSHFDWRDNNAIVIWGPRRQIVTALRGRGGSPRGVTTVMMKLAKDLIRPIVRRSGILAAAYLHVPLDGSPPTPYFPNVLTGDGHPSFCASQRHWMLADTYPNTAGDRELFLLDTRDGMKHMLGIFREPKLKVNMAASNEAMAGVDAAVLRIIGRERYAFTRSGLHCDLHPRWRNDGLQVSFDSLHEGSRQVYIVDTASIVAGC